MQVRKVSLLDSVEFSVVDYESASSLIIQKARERVSFGVIALPVHGLVISRTDSRMSNAISKAGLVVPDGQPIRWAMNFLYKARLKDRVYGPTLTLHVLRKASEEGLRVFFYGGNTEKTLNLFTEFAQKNFPGIIVCGKYREPLPDGRTLSATDVNKSGAHILLVGRGCPTQELWIGDHVGKVNAVMMGIGAAFSFHAGTLQQAPLWMQNNGLEWLFRLSREPKRLFARYVVTNTLFILFITGQIFRMKLLQIKN